MKWQRIRRGEREGRHGREGPRSRHSATVFAGSDIKVRDRRRTPDGHGFSSEPPVSTPLFLSGRAPLEAPSGTIRAGEIPKLSSADRRHRRRTGPRPVEQHGEPGRHRSEQSAAPLEFAVGSRGSLHEPAPREHFTASPASAFTDVAAPLRPSSERWTHGRRAE